MALEERGSLDVEIFGRMGRVDGRKNFVMFVMQRGSSWRKEVGRRGCGSEWQGNVTDCMEFVASAAHLYST
jgi:hypothetical protein